MIKPSYLGTVLVLLISVSGYSQTPAVNYHSYFDKGCKFSLDGKIDSATRYIFKWVSCESSLDSLERIFVATDLDPIRTHESWENIIDAVHSRYQREYSVVTFNQISYELWVLGIEDQKMRTLNKYYKIPMPKMRTEEFSKFVAKNIEERKSREQRVMEIIKQYGWPTYTKVGKRASRAAFLIVQHSDKKSKLKKRVLPKLKKAVKEKESDPMHYAMLLDRYLKDRGKKQLYGTQLIAKTVVDDGEIAGMENLELYPIADEHEVDERREKLGLPPLREELKEKWNIDYSLTKP